MDKVKGLFVSQWPIIGQSTSWGGLLMVRCYSVSQADIEKQHGQCYLLEVRVIFQMLKGQSGLKHGNRGKRQALKSASTDLGTADVGEWQKAKSLIESAQPSSPLLPVQDQEESQLRVGDGNGAFCAQEQTEV